ncbi:hypothetical protein BKA82DRAFT_1005795 [Pisolithus tinctorius]|uniref:Uncharacterized protein n=1 Tax=Pisolithus tinctorius Marx 270 TaxID=870435 RepID=A0A0C3N9T4_PISTI|nr:hypothetical protein BKA82DRAFT_1005795 [Pisolithus tinctorius]KIN97829.1 hypothetical protein M404DRAFT_1005795 [Pisolithus tinctorius Marx 270]
MRNNSMRSIVQMIRQNSPIPPMKTPDRRLKDIRNTLKNDIERIPISEREQL